MFSGIATSLSRLINDGLSIYPAAVIDLETVTTKKMGADQGSKQMEFLVARDGSVGFMVEVDGAQTMVGVAEWNKIVNILSQEISALLPNEGRMLQCAFQYDPESNHKITDTIVKRRKEQSRRLGLNWDDIHEASGTALAKYLVEEQNLWCFWLMPSTVTDHERKQARDSRNKRVAIYPSNTDIQRPGGHLDALLDRVNSVVAGLSAALNNAGLAYRVLDARTALHRIRSWLVPGLTGPDWRVRLPGDPISGKLTPEMASGRGALPSDLLWPSLGQQVLPADPELPTPNRVVLNGVHYAPISMRLIPETIAPFQDLINRLMSNGTPWRASIRITGNGPSIMQYRDMLARLLSFDKTSPDNKKITIAAEAIRDRVIASVPQVQIQVDFVTWARDDETLSRRVSVVASAIQGWGETDVEEKGGMAWKSLLSSIPGLRLTSPANRSCVTLKEAVSMLPVGRPATPWSTGSMLLRSMDGKLLPYQPGSSLQTTHVVILSAPMGYGKSVTLASYIKALLDTHGEGSWPYITILDIGPSSSGLISLIQSALPSDKRYLAAHFKLRKDPARYGVNPFDLPLGSWMPFPAHKTFLINLFAMLAPEVSGGEGFFERIIDAAYRRYAPMIVGGRPKLYQRGIEVGLDEFLAGETYVSELSPSPSWWEVADIAFKANRPELAETAQRYAVPTLADIAGIPRDPEVSHIYMEVEIAATKEKLPSYVARALTEAVSLYPHIACPTKFSIGSAKIVALDLNEVCPKGSGPAKRETAIMYMVARQIGAGHFYQSIEDVDSIRVGHDPSGNPMPLVNEYRRYQAKRINEIHEARKLLAIDEYHRTDQVAFQQQIEVDIREGRKFRVWMLLASQAITDFPEIVMRDLASSVVILGTGTEKGVERVAEQMGLTGTAVYYLGNRLHKPGPHGATMLTWHKTAKGTFVQFQVLTLGPVEMWALSTTPVDAALRKKMYERMDPAEARRRLAARFPSGSAEKEIEKIRQSMEVKYGAAGDEEDADDAILSLAEELSR